MIRTAAVKIKMLETGQEATIHCLRHHYAFETLADLGIHRTDYQEIAEGFITDKGEFLDRKEAMTHAMACGQLSATTKYSIGMCVELFSEDLW